MRGRLLRRVALLALFCVIFTGCTGLLPPEQAKAFLFPEEPEPVSPKPVSFNDDIPPVGFADATVLLCAISLADAQNTQIARGVQDRLDELDIGLTVADAGGNLATQTDILQDAPAAGYKVLICLPGDMAALEPLLIELRDGGLPVLIEYPAEYEEDPFALDYDPERPVTYQLGAALADMAAAIVNGDAAPATIFPGEWNDEDGSFAGGTVSAGWADDDQDDDESEDDDDEDDDEFSYFDD